MGEFKVILSLSSLPQWSITILNLIYWLGVTPINCAKGDGFAQCPTHIR
jgi:hypothetical protein